MTRTDEQRVCLECGGTDNMTTLEGQEVFICTTCYAKGREPAPPLLARVEDHVLRMRLANVCDVRALALLEECQQEVERLKAQVAEGQPEGVEAARALHDRLASENFGNADVWHAHLMLADVAAKRLQLLEVEQNHRATLAAAQAEGVQ